MATKKGSKSSKTAHVLNVLSGVKQEVPVEEETHSPEEPEVKAAAEVAPPPRPPVRAPILEMARANDEVLSEQIQHLLEEDWELEEEAEEEGTVSDEPQELPSLEPEVEPPVVMPSPEVDIPLDLESPQGKTDFSAQGNTDRFSIESEEPNKQVEEGIPSPVPEEAMPLKKETTSTVGQPTEEDFCPVNVMQLLVDEKCMRYVKMFEMCDCSRCVADVKALALTNLMPKYLVMRCSEVVPMLSVYERRFNAAITAQLISACKVVMDHPRHSQ